MAKNEIDAKTLEAALERLHVYRIAHIKKMANPKIGIGARPRLFLDVQEVIEKLEQLKSRQKKTPVATPGPMGPKVFKG